MNPLRTVFIGFCLLAILGVGCDSRPDSTVILPDQETATAEAAKMEAYNQQYEQSMKGPAQQ